MNGTVLIVEDEEKLARLLADYLEQSGYRTFCMSSGRNAAALVQTSPPDIVLLDLMLPEKDGLEVCKDIRSFSAVPIIMITARIEEIDRLLGLELGADDYICKPFSPREVVARVKAVLRRSGDKPPSTTKLLQINELCHTACLQGCQLELTAVEFKLLCLLHATPGRIYTRSQLMDRIYPDIRVVSERTIDSHVKKLRKKIAAITPDKELIHAVYGIGYKFELNSD